ncbi:hypothetical protein HFO56_34065 [Rhizobium laguerreae]|uniref:hypothetical protein n=1 Tax=Rhizobium laguerreae TaxID=1076926 RepID=UPI001C919F7E|nr:hypothetical protein [Rhizobium laguerreae]MBY3157353.1 hypothetical protein [Rhizobium laguerreae]
MRDDTVQLPRTFPAETIEVTRVIFGVPGSSLRRREITDLVEVTWGRHTNAQVEIHVNGVFVDDRSVNCDEGVLGSCIVGALDEWTDIVKEFGATEDDRFEVSISAWITDTPTFGYAKDNVFGQKCYFRVPREGSAFFIGVPATGLDSMNPEDRRTLDTVEHSKTKIRSSLWSAEENKAATATFLKRISEVVRTELDQPA